MGKRFEVAGGLERAFRSCLSAELSDVQEDENAYERECLDRLLEVYAPVQEQGALARVLTVIEF